MISIDLAHEHLALLGLNHEATEKDVKRAYAKYLKKIDQASQIKEFTELRASYEIALNFCKQKAQLPQVVLNQQDTDLDNESVEKKELFENESYTKPELLLPLQITVDETVNKALADLIEYAKQVRLRTPDECILELERITSSDEMQSLEAHNLFERALIHALAREWFSTVSAPMLVAASTVFGWNQQNYHVLLQCGESGRYIEKLLDELIQLNGDTTWLTLGRADKYWDERTLDAERIAFKKRFPALFEFSYPASIQDTWEKDKKSAPLLWRTFNWYLDSKKKHPFYYLLLNFLSIPLIIYLSISTISIIGKFQITKELSLCQKTYTSVSGNNWKSIMFNDLLQLQTCSKNHVPLNCADQNKLRNLLREAHMLGFSNYLMFDDNPYAFEMRPQSGLAYEAHSGTDCKFLLNFLKNSRWIEINDELAAKKIVQQVAACDRLRFSTAHQNQIIFLKQTTMWPIGESKVKGPLIDYKQLVESVTPDDEAPPFDRNISWPKCTPGPLKLSTPQ